MKYILLIVLSTLLFGCKSDTTQTISQNLIIIEQDYDEALKVASKEGKLLFIDFYTTWCAPCKKLDKLVFQNDSIQQILKKDVILLRYDAENDSIFHLSKKHHVSSYPTGLIVNSKGYVLHRKYGFAGEIMQSLSKSVLTFTNEGVALNAENTILKGYSNRIDPSQYPKFYVDYVERTNTKTDALELNAYWKNTSNIFSEAYFSTLVYFARDASDDIAQTTLANRDKYAALYGNTDVEILLYFLSSGKFNQAIKAKSQQQYEEAIVFAKTALSKKWLDNILPSFEKDYLIAQGKWDVVFAINEDLKNSGDFSNGAINHFCWNVYKKCDDPIIISKCIDWMREITTQEPTYAFLDTYAFLTYKSGDNTGTKRIAQQAIAIAKKENEKAKSMETLLKKL